MRLVILLLLGLNSCQLSDRDWVEPVKLARTWRFVGVGNLPVDANRSFDQFDYDNAPILNLTRVNRLGGFLGVNDYDGVMTTTVDYTHPQHRASGGKVRVEALNQTNLVGTAGQMQLEQQLLTGLRQATNYHLDIADSPYYTLSVTYGGNSEYLYFVSKR